MKTTCQYDHHRQTVDVVVFLSLTICSSQCAFINVYISSSVFSMWTRFETLTHFYNEEANFSCGVHSNINGTVFCLTTNTLDFFCFCLTFTSLFILLFFSLSLIMRFTSSTVLLVGLNLHLKSHTEKMDLKYLIFIWCVNMYFVYFKYT